MINFEEELKKFHPSLEVEDAEEAIYNQILDLDADTGGYNLQTAFSTGYLAGISAAKAL